MQEAISSVAQHIRDAAALGQASNYYVGAFRPKQFAGGVYSAQAEACLGCPS
jgi:hypothetical protein